VGAEPQNDGSPAALRAALATGSGSADSLRYAFQHDLEFSLNLFCAVVDRRFGEGSDIRDITALTARLRAERPGFPALEAEQVIRWVLGEERLGTEIDWAAQKYTEVFVAVLAQLLDDWRPSEAELDELFRLTSEQAAGARAVLSDIAPALAGPAGEPPRASRLPDRAADLEALHLVALGLQAASLGRYQDALTAFDRAVALNANSFWAAFGRAEAYAGLEWWEQAVAEYRRAVNLDPGKASAWSRLARAERHHGNLGEALQSYNRAVELDSQQSASLAGRGAVQEALSHAELALADYERAIELDDGNRWAIERRADLCRRTGQQGATTGRDQPPAADNEPQVSESEVDALVRYNRTLGEDPTDVDALVSRGLIYHDRGDYDLALADLTLATELHPGNYMAAFGRASCFSRLQLNDQAVAEFSRAAQLDPAEAMPHMGLGVAYLDLDSFEKALAEFSTAIEMEPRDPRALGNRAVTYIALGRYEDAIADADKAIQLSHPAVGWIQDVRAEACRLAKRYQDALHGYNRAIELDDRDAEAYAGRGQTYLAMGENAERAQRDLRRAIELDPGLEAEIGALLAPPA
jgi:tetratricopeptide (TPR) repeat protein